MTSSSSTALAGRTAVVTGGGRGIGAATAKLLAAHGAAVAVNYHSNTSAADAVVASIGNIGGKAIAVRGDVTDSGDMRRVVDRARSALGTPDLLVANAIGIRSLAFGPLLANDPTAIATGVAEQVRAVLAPVAAVADTMAENGGGSVVVVSAAGAGQANAWLPMISTAKAAANALVRNLALDLGPRNITVNAVAPGFVRTDASAGHVDEQARAGIAAGTPLRRTAEPEDVAAAILSLVSGSGFVTGAFVPVDGGATL